MLVIDCIVPSIYYRICCVGWVFRVDIGEPRVKHRKVQKTTHNTLVIAEKPSLALMHGAMETHDLAVETIQEIEAGDDANGPVEGRARESVVFFHAVRTL